MTLEYMKKLARVSHIPEAWDLTTVGEVCKVRNDLRKPISVEERSNIQGSYPYYGPTGVLDYIDEYLVDGEFALIGEDGDHFLKPQDKPQTMLVNGKLNANNHVHLIQSTKRCHAKWFYLYFHNRDITNFLSRQGANRYKLNKETLLRLPILVPPTEEQVAIYDANINWVEAIDKTERLIQAKKSQLNQIANELIYEQVALGRWTEVNARTLFKERRETTRGDLPLLSITNTHGVIPRDETNRKDTSNVDKSKYLRICPGDIGYNTMRMWQGVSALSELDGIVSPAYTICIPGKKLDPQYVAFLFKTPFMIHRFYRYSQGLTSDTWNLKFRHFGEVKIPLPSLDEQERISETLSTARREISLLKQLAEKYRNQKRGLMQKLLTGEWRVNTDEEVD